MAVTDPVVERLSVHLAGMYAPDPWNWDSGGGTPNDRAAVRREARKMLALLRPGDRFNGHVVVKLETGIELFHRLRAEIK